MFRFWKSLLSLAIGSGIFLLIITLLGITHDLLAELTGNIPLTIAIFIFLKISLTSLGYLVGNATGLFDKIDKKFSK